MSAYGDLFRLFPSKVLDLAVDECLELGRPAHFVDAFKDLDCPCEFCPAQALYMHGDYYTRQATCGSPACFELHEFYWHRESGGSRRRGFMAWNGDKYWDVGTEERKALALAYMLRREAASCQKIV